MPKLNPTKSGVDLPQVIGPHPRTGRNVVIINSVELNILLGKRMKSRLAAILGIACVVAAGLYFVPRYLADQNRFKSAAELFEEQMQKESAEQVALIRANAKTEEDRIYADFLERILSRERYSKEVERLQIVDGVDEFEAWMFTRAYFRAYVAAFGRVRVPQKDGSRWVVTVAYGSPPPQLRPVFVDAVSGAVSCDGYETVADPLMLFSR